jgi:hypothetical protein
MLKREERKMTLGNARHAALIAAFLFTSAFPAVAGVTGSRHDFTGKPFAPGGSCSACHREHYASEAKALWPRDLSQENGFFDQTSGPDYVPGGTILCYDCHVDYITNGSGATPDNAPPDSDWSSGREPQDIAFTDGPGSNVGYYELEDGSVPGIPPPAGDPTGGHYWKTEPAGTPDYAKGDKLPCSLCHDPHDKETGSNEAMFRTAAPDGTGGTIDLGDGHTASSNTRNGSGTGRQMCAACHGYSDSGAPAVMWGVTLPVPPPSVSDHLEAAPGACTLCHRHNFIEPAGGSCESCHDGDGPGPNVMGDGSNATGTGGTPKPYDDGSWGYNVNGHGANGTATNTPTGLAPNAECTGCHDVSDPPGTHNDGTLNSHSTGNVNANTYHLNAVFIYSGAPANEYDVQVAFDTACVGECHAGSGVKYMDHDSESNDAVPDPPGAVEFGLHLTYVDGDTKLHTHGYLGSPWPADSDVRDWAGRTAEPDYAICASCHDPHGTTIDPVGEMENSNRMLRETWKSNSDLCLVCHW